MRFAGFFVPRTAPVARYLAGILILGLSASAVPAQTVEPQCGEGFAMDATIAAYASTDRFYLGNAYEYVPGPAEATAIKLTFYTAFLPEDFPDTSIRVMVHSANRRAPDVATQHFCREVLLTGNDVVVPDEMWIAVPYLFSQVWKLVEIELSPPIPDENDLVSIGYEMQVGQLQDFKLFPVYSMLGYDHSDDVPKASSLFSDDSGYVKLGLGLERLAELLGFDPVPPDCKADAYHGGRGEEPDVVSAEERLQYKLQKDRCEGSTYIRVHVEPD